MKEKLFSIFDWVKAIIDTKPEWESFTQDQQKIFNGYLIHRFISMNPKYIEVVNYVQGLNIKDNKSLYKVYCYMIPKSKNTYSAYIKSTNKKPNVDVLKYVAEYFECSISEAEEYSQLTDKEWTKNILEAKGIDEKTIKKLIK